MHEVKYAYAKNKDNVYISINDIHLNNRYEYYYLLSDSLQELQMIPVINGERQKHFRTKSDGVSVGESPEHLNLKAFLCNSLEFYCQDIDEIIKAKYAKKAKGQGEDVFDNDLGQLVQVMPAYTITHASDVAFDSFKAQESVAVKSYVDAKKEYDNFQAEYNSADAAGKVRLKESLIQSRMVLEKADQDIQSARQAQTNLTESVMEAAKGQGIDAAKYYTKELQTEVLKEVKSNNIKNIASIGFSTSLDKFNVKAKAYNPETNKPLVPYTLKPKETINIDLAGYEGKDLPVYSDLDFTYKKKFINTVSAIKRNGKYELFFPPNVRGSANDENYAFIDRFLIK